MIRFEPHNHQKKLLALIAAGLMDGTGVEIVDIRHDDWCDLLCKGGKCNCDPDIYLRGKKLELPQGT